MLNATPSLANPDFEHNAKGMKMTDMVGRTMVGVTRDSSRVFSIYLSRDGKVDFVGSNGNKSTGTWRRRDAVIVCIKGLVVEKPNDEVCKRAPELGRGLDWMTVDLHTSGGKTTWSQTTKSEHRGSSQMVYSFAGNVAVDRNSYVSDVTKWGGHLIVGRTLKDKEAWFASFSIDGKLDFVFASGRRFKGSYTLKTGEVCMTFPDNPSANGCRKPTLRDGKVLWASSTDGGAVSEIVFMKRIEEPKPVIPPYQPRENFLMGQNIRAISPSPDRLTVASASDNKIDFWDTNTGRRIGSIADTKEAIDSAWSPDSQKFLVAYPNGVEIFDARTGKLIRALPSMSGRVRISAAALLPNGDVAIGDRAGNVHILNGVTGELKHSRQIAAGPATAFRDIAVNRDGRIGVSTFGGVIAAFDSSLEPLPDLRHEGKSKAGSISMSLDGRYLLAGTEDSRIYLFDFAENSAPKLQSRSISRRIGESVDFGAESSLAVAAVSGRGAIPISIETMSLGAPWELTQSDTIRAVPSAHRGEIIILEKSGRLTIWSPDEAAAEKFRDDTRAVTSAARVQHTARRDAFERADNGSSSAEATAGANSKRAYDAGNCDVYDQLMPSIRLVALKPDCREAAERRATMASFETAIRDLNCDRAEELARSIQLNTGKVATCRATVKRNEETRLYRAAIEARDCEAVRKLAPSFNEPQAGADCDLSVALALDTPRRMYLAAVQFDTAGDRPRAREIYTAVMQRFPENDLALDAARRLTAFADMEKQERENAAMAAQQAEAIKAAEERAKAAEAAALEAQRRAEEEEKRREARERTEKRLQDAKSQIEAMNSKYGGGSNPVQLSTRIVGTERYYNANVYFEIRPTARNAITLRDFCKVTIETSVYPTERRVNTSSTRYFEPESGRSRVELDFWWPEVRGQLDQATRDAYDLLHMWFLSKMPTFGTVTNISDGKVFSGTTLTNGRVTVIPFKAGLVVHEETGGLRPKNESGMRVDGRLVAFQLRQTGHLESFGDDLKKLARTCGLGSL